MPPNFPMPSVPTTHPKHQGHTIQHLRLTSILFSASSSQGGLYLLPQLTQLLPLSKKIKQMMHTAKHGETNFPLPSPALGHQMEVPNPSSKILKHLRSRNTCRRVVETGLKTSERQPVWISPAHAVAPSVPTPAQSSKEWERFRCSWGAGREALSQMHLHIPVLGRQCNVNLTKCHFPEHILRWATEWQEEFAR